MDSHLLKLRHSSAHILASAVLQIWPNTQLSIGPANEEGFFYDFDISSTISTKDFPLIEKKMQELIKQNLLFEKIVVSKKEAEIMIERGRIGSLSERDMPSFFKKDLLKKISAEEEITIYKVGEFWDLCSGPHVRSTGECSAFRILRVASAFYQGDKTKTSMQRVFGTCFSQEKELENYLTQLEEAKKRDHRNLGKELKIFSIEAEVGQGLILWLPNGATIREILEKFLSEKLAELGYQRLYTPHIGRIDLYRKSGHFPFYQESQFPPILDRETLNSSKEELSASDWLQELEEGKQKGYLLRPMNCPHHIQVYSSDFRSYRDLPLRFFEFGTVYRWEKSGELGGMTRARGFTQDDGHIFCTEEQLKEEIFSCIDLTQSIFKIFRFSDYKIFLSTRGKDAEKYVGDSKAWEKSESILKEAIQESGISFTEQKGEAAFYGPKIDFVFKDSIGRDWQLGTIQIDYNLPFRFDLKYIGKDNKRHTPIMIHRAPLGSLERFVGLLIEHFDGKFPVWLAPEQVRILPLSDNFLETAEEIASLFRKRKLRFSVDSSSGKIGSKIRLATLQRVPYTIVIGEREKETRCVSARFRNGNQLENMPIKDFIHLVCQESEERKIPHDFKII